ncbi:hypothetical protein H0H93_007610 [Arthromyces matolae]|nr:hypothetical protein H0H93_007610 [Arthromyces matolae]
MDNLSPRTPHLRFPPEASANNSVKKTSKGKLYKASGVFRGHGTPSLVNSGRRHASALVSYEQPHASSTGSGYFDVGEASQRLRRTAARAGPRNVLGITSGAEGGQATDRPPESRNSVLVSHEQSHTKFAGPHFPDTGAVTATQSNEPEPRNRAGTGAGGDPTINQPFESAHPQGVKDYLDVKHTNKRRVEKGVGTEMKVEDESEGLLERSRRWAKEQIFTARQCMEDIMRTWQDQHQEELDILRSRLAEKTQELESAHLFINQADQLSCADIVSLANSLNAEILQCAALIADTIVYNLPRQCTVHDMDGELWAAYMIGDGLTKALKKQRSLPEGEIDPTSLQLALQICLVYCSNTILNSWTLCSYGDWNDGFLNTFYAQIWRKENQTVAGRWRSIAQAHGCQGDGLKRSQDLFSQAVQSVLTVAGSNNVNPLEKYQGLSVIVDLSLRLRAAIGQQFTSVDIFPLTSTPGDLFDPSIMEDTYAEEERKDGHKEIDARGYVVGSTGLGLFCKTKTCGGGVMQKLMLKPKVVLNTTLAETDPSWDLDSEG